MNNNQATDIAFVVILSTKIARYNHFEARYGQKKVQFIHNLAFSRPSKSVFTITSNVYCDKTIQWILLKFLVVLDIGLEIVNPFLYCKYLINSWNGEKPRIMLFMPKKHEKSEYPLQLRRIFQDPPMIRKSRLAS